MSRIESWTEIQKTAFAVGIFLVVFYLDLATSSDRGVSHLYYVPIWISAWFLNRSALKILLIATGIVLVANPFEGLRSPTEWTSILIRLLLYGISGAVVSHWRESFNRERRSARHDVLTGCLNSYGFREQFGRMFAEARVDFRPFALLYFDVDHFKRLNDTLGHFEADRALRAIGILLRRSMRKSDVISRIGGDEFIVALRSTNAEMAFAVAARTRKLIEQELQRRGYPISISMGCVAFIDLPPNIQAAMKIADDAMYHAKNSGRSRMEPFIWRNSEIEILPNHASFRAY